MKKYEEEILHYLMSAVGGFLGLYAICAHGSYASAQTGNLMRTVIALEYGDVRDWVLRLGAFVLFCGGIVVSWLLREFCHLPMRELCIWADGAALLLTVHLPQAWDPFLLLYPIFFASSFQWGTFSGVEKYASASLFLTGNLKNSLIHWLKYIFYRKPENFIGARIYTLAIVSYLLGGFLGCAAVKFCGVRGAYWGFPLLAVAWLVIKPPTFFQKFYKKS